MNEVGVLCTLYSTTKQHLKNWGVDVGRNLLYFSMCEYKGETSNRFEGNSLCNH